MTSCEDDVLRIARKLERMNNGTKSMDTALDLLKAVGKLPITIDVLTKTRIGMTVNELRKKTDNGEVAKQAKTLIKNWKGLLERKNGESAQSESISTLPQDSSNSLDGENGNCQSHSTPSNSAPLPTSFPPNWLQMADQIRGKCIRMLVDAMRSGELPDGTLDPEQLASQIESRLFEAHHGTTEKYKSALRSRVFNLRDKKNPALRENVLTGVVAPGRFAVMTSEEMASDDIRKMRDKFTKEAINEHQMSVQEGTPSDMFKCGKCYKKNCTYTQLQTRSADEPMTTFVYCRECGNRWKVSTPKCCILDNWV